jgi:importin subunit beta-1
MSSPSITEILVSSLGADATARNHAQQWLADAEKSNPSLLLQMLIVELHANDRPADLRRMAGLYIKNMISGKSEATRLESEQRWLQGVDPNIRNQVKLGVLATLPAPERAARATAAQVIAKIAAIELPKNLWPELIPALLGNMSSDSEALKQSTLESLGYVCEEIDPEVLKSQANQILTAVCKGIKEPNNGIKLAGCNALFNSLEFVRANFEKEVERNYIMQVVCEAFAVPDTNIKVASMECLVRIAQLYYDKLAPYMQRIFNMTLESIKNEPEQVAQQAVEFWSTVCDEEIDLDAEAEENEDQKSRSQNFIRGALKYLVPVLTETLTKQDDEPDEDTWNVAMAAGTCLSLVAVCVRDEVVDYVLPFVQIHINSQNWKFREAATLAFGSILDGPKERLNQLITQAIPILVNHLKSDPVVFVKDTTAWTLGRVCDLHPNVITPPFLQELIIAFVGSLEDNPRVASNICWAIHNLAIAYAKYGDQATAPLSPFFKVLLEKLLRVTERSDADENNLRCSAYEAINVLIQNAANDTHPIILSVLPIFIESLHKTFAMQIVSQDDRDQLTELQSLLCGALQVIIQKLGSAVKPYADQMMQLFLSVFNTKSASVHEEALMAVGAIANAVESGFENYMAHFGPFLKVGLRNYEEHQVCAVAVGVVGDIARALGPKLVPYCDDIVSLLLQDLQNQHLNRNVKPPILSCFGDIGLAIGGEFVKYLSVVMGMLQQASTTTVDMNDYDLVDYLNSLREGIFEAYTGIVQGLRSDNMADPHFLPYASHVIGFVSFVYADNSRSESVTRGAAGILGDLAHALGPQVKLQLNQPFVKELLTECARSEDENTASVGAWAKDIISAL